MIDQSWLQNINKNFLRRGTSFPIETNIILSLHPHLVNIIQNHPLQPFTALVVSRKYLLHGLFLGVLTRTQLLGAELWC